MSPWSFHRQLWRLPRCLPIAALASLIALACLDTTRTAAQKGEPGAQANQGRYPAPPKPKLVPPGLGFLMMDLQVDDFVRAPLAREKFKTTGKGLTVAIIDTGINPVHKDFNGAGHLIPGMNFSDDGGPSDTKDLEGHGSNVAGIIAGRNVNEGGMHTGIAPDARIIPLKVFPGGDFSRINKALEWVKTNRDAFNITVVNMSLGSGHNAKSVDEVFNSLPESIRKELEEQRRLIKELRDLDVAVVVSAGNSYFKSHPAQGMAFPGICEETVSVGAVFDSKIAKRANGDPLVTYVDGGQVFFTEPGRCTVFSQRLSQAAGGTFRTDIFAPGYLVTSAGPFSDDPADHPDSNETTQDGTSQAAPVTAGVILLLQQRYSKLIEGVPGMPVRRPPVSLIEECLRNGGVEILDAEDDIGQKIDNVQSTGEKFIRLDAYKSLEYLDAKFQSDIAHLRADIFKSTPADRMKILDNAKILTRPLKLKYQK